MWLHIWPLGAVFYLVPPLLQRRQQSVQYEKLPGALHQLLINLQGERQDIQYMKKGT